jgi:hypothetical protein
MQMEKQALTIVRITLCVIVAVFITALILTACIWQSPTTKGDIMMADEATVAANEAIQLAHLSYSANIAVHVCQNWALLNMIDFLNADNPVGTK